MRKKFKSAPAKPQGTQMLFVVSLAAVGIGNISVPPSIPLLSSLYLPISLVFVFVALLLGANRVAQQLRYPILVLLTFLAFLPGFLITPLNPYGETKLQAVAIAFLLVVAPAAFRGIASNLELLFKVIIIVSVSVSLMLLLYGHPDIAGRYTLWGLNPISTGRVAGVSVVILCTLLIIKWQIIKSWWILIPAIFICLLAALQTGSRGPILAIGVSIVTVLVVGGGLAKSRGYRVVASLAIVGGAILLFASSTVEGTRVLSADANGRDVLFSVALTTIRDNPIGMGWGNFYLAIPDFPRVNSYTLYPHNIFLEIGAEGGWLALGVFALLLICAICNLFKGIKAGSYPAAIILSILIFALVNAAFSSDFVGNRLLWLAVGLSLLPFDSTYDDINLSSDESLSHESSFERGTIK